MNDSTQKQRFRPYERYFGPCSCETLGACPLCTVMRAVQHGDDFPTAAHTATKAELLVFGHSQDRRRR